MTPLLTDFHPLVGCPLPVGWAEVPVGAACRDISAGFSSGKSNIVGKGIPHLRPMNVTSDGEVTLEGVRYVASKVGDARLADGDLLLTNTSSTLWVGKTGLVRNPGDWAFSNHMTRLRLLDGLVPEFFARQLHFLCRAGYFAHHCTEHVNQSSIAPKLLCEKVPLRVPPVEEQRRIIERLSELEEQREAARSHLADAQAELEKARHSILTSAFSGLLTADWRNNKESGSWKQTNVGECLESLNYGTAVRCSPVKRGVAVLRIPNIVTGTLRLSDLKYAVLDKRESDKLAIRMGDILMVRSNGSPTLLGTVASATSSSEGFAFAGYLMRLRPKKTVNPRYLLYALRSPAVRNAIENNARSSAGVNNINSEEVKALPLPLPPLEEQSEIVRRLDEALAQVKMAADAHAAAEADLVRLNHSFAGQAFRGELVAQIITEEPAQTFLDRATAILASEPTEPKRRMPRKTKSNVKPRSLLDVLKASAAGMSPEDLFTESGRDETNLEQVEKFYADLRDLVGGKKVKESRPDSETIILTAV